MSLCPIQDENWKLYVKQHGERAAMKAWIENDHDLPNVRNYDMGNMSEVTDELRKVTGIPVLINTETERAAEVVKTGEDKTLIVNPLKFENDAIVNEYGHVFIEVLGGVNTPINNVGVRRLQGSTVISAVEKNTSGLTEEEKSQVALSMALAEDPFNLFANKADAVNFEKWTTGFFSRLEKTLGIPKEDARKLASKSVNAHKSEKVDAAAIEKELYEEGSGKDFSKLTTKEQLALKAMQIIETKINQLERKLNTASKSQKGALAKLKKLYKQFERHEAEAALYGFVKTAEHQIGVVEDKFKQYTEGTSKANLDGIKYLRDAMLSFDTDLLKEIRNDLTAEQSDIAETINNALIKQDNIHEMYKKLAAKFLVEEVKVPVEIIQSRYERQAELEFTRLFRDIKDKTERAKAKDEYVQEYLESHKEEIEADKEKYLENFLTVINRDLSAFDAIVGNPKDLNNDIVQTVAQIFEQMDYDIRQESMFLVKNAEDLHSKYIKYFGKKSTQEEQWAPLLSGESKAFAPSLAARGSEKWNEIKEGKYKGTPVEEMYDFLMEIAKARDAKLPASHRLGNKLPIMHKNFYERVGENGIFKAVKEGTVDQFKIRKDETEFGELNNTSAAARFSLEESVKVGVSVGEERKIIPIHYRNKSIAETDRSLDVLTLMVLDGYQAIQFDHKRKIANRVEGMLDLVKEAKVYERSGILGRLKTDKNDNPILKKEISNVAKAVENIIENRLYGIQSSGDPQTSKIANNIRQYSSFVSLFMNYMSGGANLNQGMAMVFMEGAGSKFYGIKNVRNASTKYGKDTPYIMKDNTNRVFKSKTNLLREMYDANSEYVALHNEFSKDSALKREGNLGVGFAFNSVAEHTAQSIGMYSVLDNIKVKDKDGNFINSKGEVVTDREKAMTLDEAYSVGYQNRSTKKTISADEFNALTDSQKGGYIPNVLHLDSKVASTDRTEEGVNTFAVSQILKRINRDLFGNYDKKNRSVLERHALGGLVSHMRGWMEPGIRKRWKGLGSVFVKDAESWKKFRTVKNTELRDEDLYYNVETKEFEEGMYVTFLRFGANVLGEIKALKFKALSENWKDLTDMEKNNIMKSTVEGVVLPVLAFIIFSMLTSAIEDDDDEDKFMKELAALYAIRLNKELITYYDPSEWLRTLRSPAVTLTLLETTKDAVVQLLMAPTEEYKKGKNEGDNKFIKKLGKVLPGKALLKDPADVLKFYSR